jgi:hypothetical protein
MQPAQEAVKPVPAAEVTLAIRFPLAPCRVILVEPELYAGTHAPLRSAFALLNETGVKRASGAPR